MRKITINLSNRVYIILVSIVLILVLAMGVYAYGTSNPPVFGHSAGEIEGAGVPSGAVMAFTTSCPSGWSEYVAARGRVIVGRNTAEAEFNVIGETGGEKEHILSIGEMPTHQHTIDVRSSSFEYWVTLASTDMASSSGGAGSVAGTPVTSPAGGGTPHNNLQPYIALVYCIKN